ncbi:MAG: aspartate aminotransferase family protein [Firmicutes bacterium]|nr:aspartate aminotransferase family protein [Bacillota bacterium]
MSDRTVEERYREFVATSFVERVEPVVPVWARGARVRGEDGREYVDAFSGISVVNAGHAHPRVVEAARRQMEAYLHVQSYTYHVPVVAELAERLAQVTPGRLRKTFFGNGGAEGIETALRMAKAYTGRHEFVSLTHSFHGRSLATLSLTGNSLRRRRGGPFMPGVAFAPAPYAYRWPHPATPEEVAREAAAAVEETIRTQTSDDVAAFIAEPVMGEGGIIVPPTAYLRYVREILDRRGILFIADEVQTGFGRTGRLFAVEHSGVEPDILVMAKGIADGLPLSAVIARPEIADALKPGEHLSTFGGNPVSCAAALANLEVMEEEGLPARAAALGERAIGRLRDALAGCETVGEVRGLGLMIGVELVEDRETKAPARAIARAVRERSRERGVLIGVGGMGGNVLRIQPPLVIEEADLERVVATVAEAVAEAESQARAHSAAGAR